MTEHQPTTNLSKVLLTGPNLAYSVALQQSLDKLEEYKKEMGEDNKAYQFMLEALVSAILSQPAIGDA